ncbi:Uu.00g115810.m01.CDS01 [Anthostomella pinea]|uniref:Uu.00g115810.m01.CDS01 n=1 Tax=Anthostomella pinea TaxID=933095 RepID=A0AAI8YGX2_9PEZI|nr:Uu.00g115810.m01.CDS01 [Anthostomella pinea]
MGSSVVSQRHCTPNTEAVGDVLTIEGEGLLDDADIKNARRHRLPVQDLADETGEHRDGGHEASFSELSEPTAGIETNARKLGIAQIALLQGDEVRQPVLEDVHGLLAEDVVAVADVGGAEHEPTGEAGEVGWAGDTFHGRGLDAAVADRGRLHVLRVEVDRQVLIL